MTSLHLFSLVCKLHCCVFEIDVFATNTFMKNGEKTFQPVPQGLIQRFAVMHQCPVILAFSNINTLSINFPAKAKNQWTSPVDPLIWIFMEACTFSKNSC